MTLSMAHSHPACDASKTEERVKEKRSRCTNILYKIEERHVAQRVAGEKRDQFPMTGSGDQPNIIHENRNLCNCNNRGFERATTTLSPFFLRRVSVTFPTYFNKHRG